MKIALKITLFLTAILCSLPSFSQKELRGKVADFMSFMPIENASVYLQNTSIGSITNSDGKFSLRVPKENLNDTLVISSIGYKSYKMPVNEYENGTDIYLEEDVAPLDEVVVVADNRPKTGNEIMQRSIERLNRNMPDTSFIQKGFLRHKERNKNEYKWLIEAALTLYDANAGNNGKKDVKINIDEIRKSFDLRDVDSLLAYVGFLKSRGQKVPDGSVNRRSVKTAALIDAIRWNDDRVNGLDQFFGGRLNLLRNVDMTGALFGKNMLDKHQFHLDTILVDNGRKIYKIRIDHGKDYVGLNTPNVYNEGLYPSGWVYIYYDNYAIKRIEYDLTAASAQQKTRAKSLFDTQLLHRLKLNFIEFDDKMYLNYLYYETPKLVNAGERSSSKEIIESAPGFDKGAQFYFTIQEILFTDIVSKPDAIAAELAKSKWSSDLFLPKPYNANFWKNYNVLLESEEEEKLIFDLTKRAELFQQ